MKRIKYDLIFAIGRACGCSETLRKAGLQHLSFPGDWTAPMSPGQDHDLRLRADTLCGDLSGFFRPEDFHLRNTNRSVTGMAIYENLRTHYLFNHDFPFGGDFASDLPKIAEKYRRRKNRLFELIGRSRRVLVVSMDVPGDRYVNTPDDCRYARKRLGERFPSVKFDCLLVSHDPARPFEQRTFEVVEDGLFHISFDILDRKRTDLRNQPDLTLTSAALAERFAVRDYRSPEEKRRHAETRRQKRYARLGTSDALSYQLMRLKLWWHGRFNPLLGLAARMRRRKFAHIAILGVNCEPAFRFYRRWGFLDSSLFAWSNTWNLKTLTAAIRNLPALGAGTFTFHEPSRMWRCDASGVFFHGRLKPVKGAPAPTAAEIEADREELRSRLAHLKEKLVRYATAPETTLFVCKLCESDAEDPALGRKLDDLEDALAALGAMDRQLLVICERKMLGRMPQGPNRVFRAVNAYNPGAEVTNPKKGDGAGWNRIFSEFAPLRVLQKAHAFKFEAV